MHNPSTDIDHLLSRVREHDDYAAFERLFYINYNPLRSFSKKLVRINEVAEELVSEFFLKIWTHRKGIVISSSAKAYLYTAVRNRSFDHLRKEKRASWANLEEAATIPCNSVGAQQYAELMELQTTIDKAVAQLPKQCRLIFQLSRDHGLKYQEIADSLKLSVKTVETQMGRALKSLRIKLHEEQLPLKCTAGTSDGRNRLKTSNTNLTA
jgi:RNA polymerase sigma-70 factor, ECF subfamily